jgi:hypothetical protein
MLHTLIPQWLMMIEIPLYITWCLAITHPIILCLSHQRLLEQKRSAFEIIKTNGMLKYIVIDECRCVDMWGFDFYRPAYDQLGVLAIKVSNNCINCYNVLPELKVLLFHLFKLRAQSL